MLFMRSTPYEFPMPNDTTAAHFDRRPNLEESADASFRAFITAMNYVRAVLRGTAADLDEKRRSFDQAVTAAKRVGVLPAVFDAAIGDMRSGLEDVAAERRKAEAVREALELFAKDAEQRLKPSTPPMTTEVRCAKVGLSSSSG